jgi:hypothetical protein
MTLVEQSPNGCIPALGGAGTKWMYPITGIHACGQAAEEIGFSR